MRAFLAPSLVALRTELDDQWPARDRSSDGWIGDAAHAARSSHHNPDETGLVRAFDGTHDPAGGPNMHELVRQVVVARDQRIEYVIFDGRIWRSYRHSSSHPPAWTPAPYRGPNMHRRHAHFSVTKAGARQLGLWWPNLKGDKAMSLTPSDLEKIAELVRVETRAVLNAELEKILGWEAGGVSPAKLGLHWRDVFAETWISARNAAAWPPAA